MSILHNCARISGFVGADAECRNVGDTKVARFSVCSTTVRQDKETGEYVEYPEWHTVEAWGGNADYVMSRAMKGRYAEIMGKITYQQWDLEIDGKPVMRADRQGNDRPVRMEKAVIRFDGGLFRRMARAGDGTQAEPNGTTASASTSGSAKSKARKTGKAASSKAKSSAKADLDLDDEIPF